MIRIIRTKLISAIKSKRINVFLLFVVLSFITLLLLKLSNTYTKTITFNITKKEVPEAYVIVNDSSHALEITLKTNGFNLLQYYLSRPKVTVDFKNDITQTDSLYIWSKSTFFSKLNQQFDKDIELLNVTPDTLKFRFDKNEVKKIPVKLNSNISFSPGYDLFKPIVLDPDSIKVIGPQVLVDKIHAIETDSVTLLDVKNTQQKKVKLKLPKNANENLIFSNNTININIEVDKFTEGHLKVPVSIINVPENITLKYFPKKVNISYYTSLTHFKDIKPKDFLVVCDYNQINENQTILTPKVTRKPKQVRHVKVDQAQIDFIIVQ
ncbi:YbbR-like domain-containing protein [Mangrovimonas cancribranchiae]|uniref:YbbR-like domain-containing protein n=1 Tax=Mangrovimonas cancribranchiae TaxID=3080055 RepID=A0AAU6NZH8_9FLAO